MQRTEKAGGSRHRAACLGMARPALSGRRKNRGEEWAQGGFRPKFNENKRKWFVLFLFQILNEFYSNSNNF
jgi:hypothetical protein